MALPAKALGKNWMASTLRKARQDPESCAGVRDAFRIMDEETRKAGYFRS